MSNMIREFLRLEAAGTRQGGAVVLAEGRGGGWVQLGLVRAALSHRPKAEAKTGCSWD